jgi:hypothetical protein
MSEVGIHKYYCDSCKILIFGESALRLALNVNGHNSVHHPQDFAKWTGPGIVRSSRYSGPALPDLAETNPSRILPQYTQPHGVTSKWDWGTAQYAPDITPDDLLFLAEARVKW